MLIQREEWYQLNDFIDYNLYLYIMAIFLIASLGVCMQFKYFFKDMKENDYDKIE
jgi:hypothetical protein